MAEDVQNTKLTQSNYPVKNPNMSLDMPGDDTGEELIEIRGGANVSPSGPQPTDESAAPAPTEEPPANVSTEPVENGGESPYSTVKKNVDNKALATASALSDVNSVVKLIHAKGLVDKKVVEETVIELTENILDNFDKIGREEVDNYVERHNAVDAPPEDTQSGPVKKFGLFGSYTEDYTVTHYGDEKKKVDEKLSKGMFSYVSDNLNLSEEDKVMIDSLLDDAYEAYLIGDDETYNKKVTQAGALSGLDDIFDFAQFSGKISQVITGEDADFTYLDGIVDTMADLLYGSEKAFDLKKWVSEQDMLRKLIDSDAGWTREADNIARLIVGENPDDINRFKELLLNPTTRGELLSTGDAIWAGVVDVMREFFTPESLKMIAALEGIPWAARTIIKPGPVGAAYIKGAQGATFVGLGVYGSINAAMSMWEEGYPETYDDVYKITKNSLHLSLSGVFAKAGYNKVTGKGRGKTYTVEINGKKQNIPIEANLVDLIFRKSHPDLAYKNLRITEGHIHNLGFRIKTGEITEVSQLVDAIAVLEKEGVFIPKEVKSNPREFFDWVRTEADAVFGDMELDVIGNKAGVRNVKANYSHIEIYRPKPKVKKVQNDINTITEAIESKNVELTTLTNKKNPTWRDTAKIEQIKQEIQGLINERTKLEPDLILENKANEKIDIINKEREGEIIIHSDGKVNESPWSSIVIKKDGSVITNKLAPNTTRVIDPVTKETTINYSGKVGKKVVTEEAPYVDSSTAVYHGKLNKSGYKPFNRMVIHDKIFRFKEGTVQKDAN